MTRFLAKEAYHLAHISLLLGIARLITSGLMLVGSLLGRLLGLD